MSAAERHDMPGLGRGRHRGVAIAVSALALSVVAPAFATPAGAVTSRIEMATRRHKHAHKKGKHLKQAAALAWLKAAAAASTTTTTTSGVATKPKATGAAGLFSAGAGRRRVIKRPLLRVRPRAQVLASARNLKRKAKHKASPLSLPLLGLIALAPFVLMGAYLLGTDYLRRREPKRRLASLVITPAHER